MTKQKGLSILAGLLVLFAFSGCSLFGGQDFDKPAEEVVQQALANFYYTTDSAKFDLSVKGDMDAGGKYTLDVNATGSADFKDATKPLMDVVLKGTGSMEGGTNQEFEVQMKTDPQTLFFYIKKLSDFDGALPGEMTEPYKNKWWKMTVPPGTVDTTALDSRKETNMTEEEKKMKELLMSSKFFKDVKAAGTDSIMGESCTKFDMTLDKEALKNFMVESQKLQGMTPSEEDISAIAKELEVVDLKASVWVAKSNMTARALKGTFTVNDVEAKLNLDLDLKFGDLNKAVTVTPEASAEEFDPAMLMGGATVQ